MPRGDPKNFGGKHPGRPPRLDNIKEAQVYHDDVLRAKLPDLLDVMVDDAVRRRNPKTAQALIERLLGKPPEPHVDRNDALHIFLHGLAKAVKGEIVEVTPKELTPGPQDSPGTEAD